MQDPPQYQYPRQEFHYSHVSIGAHWIKNVGILAPLIIGEFVKDAAKIASVSTALLSEGMYANRIQREREECRQQGMGGR